MSITMSIYSTLIHNKVCQLRIRHRFFFFFKWINNNKVCQLRIRHRLFLKKWINKFKYLCMTKSIPYCPHNITSTGHSPWSTKCHKSNKTKTNFQKIKSSVMCSCCCTNKIHKYKQNFTLWWNSSTIPLLATNYETTLKRNLLSILLNHTSDTAKWRTIIT